MEKSLMAAGKKSQGISRFFIGNKKYVSFGLLLFLVLLPLAYVYYFQNKSNNQPEQKTVEVAVKKADLGISISTDGRLIADKNLDLLFPLTGTVKEIFVKDGQVIKKGDKIASIDTAELEFALASFETAKSVAVANLLAKQSGPSKFDVDLSKKNVDLMEKRLADIKKQNILDIKNVELTIQSAQLNYEAAQKGFTGDGQLSAADLASMNLKINQSYDDAILKSGQAFTEIENSFKEADRVLAGSEATVSSDLETFSVLNSSLGNDAEAAFDASVQLRNDYLSKYQNIKIGSDHKNILEKLDASVSLSSSVSQMLHKTTLALGATISSSKLTLAALDSYKNSISAQSTRIKSQIEALNNARQAVSSAELEKEQKIAASNNAVTGGEYKVSLAKQQLESAKLQLENTRAKANVNEREALNQFEVAKLQLSLKIEPTREVDLASLKTQILQAQNQIDETRYKIKLATVLAPIDGVISGLNIKVNDIWSDKNKVFGVIVNKNNFLVETYVEEGDIVKIKQNQKVYLTFDAIDGLKLGGVVNYISDMPKIDTNGLVTYLVRVVVDNNSSDSIKDGMTTGVEFVLAEAKNVLVLPVAAIKNINGKPSVVLSTGEVKTVETGFTDSKSVEIISGLTNGAKVLYAEK